MAVPSAKKGSDALGRRGFQAHKAVANNGVAVANCDRHETTSDPVATLRASLFRTRIFELGG